MHVSAHGKFDMIDSSFVGIICLLNLQTILPLHYQPKNSTPSVPQLQLKIAAHPFLP